jgi:hypothetical protein
MSVFVSRRRAAEVAPGAAVPAAPAAALPRHDGTVPVAEVAWRHRSRVTGRVRSIRVQPWGGVPTLECTLVDDTAGLLVIFLGRRAIAGIVPGRHMIVDGMVGAHHGSLAMLNPDYQLLAAGD